MNAWKTTLCICTVATLLLAGCGIPQGAAYDYSRAPAPRRHADLGEPIAHAPRIEHHREHRSHRPGRPRRPLPPRPAPQPHGFDHSIRSGTLTAGSLDDSHNLESYRRFVEDKVVHTDLRHLASRCWAPPLVLTVVDCEGRTVPNADVTVRAGWLQRTLQLRTRTDGRVVLLPKWDGLDARGQLTVDVTSPSGQDSTRTTIDANRSHHTITLQGTQGFLPGGLDLAFVVDCTGSMSDELEFLKVEISSIAAEISRRFPNVQQRYALVVYRDSGDRYVTRSYNFTHSLHEFQKHLGRQTAEGGGDYPEAVDRAIEAAGRLRWSRGNVARVVFHVADAPPHTHRAERALKAMDRLREKGVAVYPVVGSGAASLAEFTMRTEALLTGSSYLFLTDDSGVGNAHSEPSVDAYHVQALKGLMIRMVAGELSGGSLAPERRDIIRTVVTQRQ